MDLLAPSHLLFVLAVALLVLGPKKLPEAARTLGRSLRDFRSAMAGIEQETSSVVQSASVPVTPQSNPQSDPPVAPQSNPPVVQAPAPAESPTAPAETPAAQAQTTETPAAQPESTEPAATQPEAPRPQTEKYDPSQVPAEHSEAAHVAELQTAQTARSTENPGPSES